VLALRRLGAVLGGVRAARRQALIEQLGAALNLTPLQFMILAQAIIFILGWPLEWTEIIVIFVPIFIRCSRTSTSTRSCSARWWR
jgi:TRAP-type mannitol/chloroaromatic compound transport system permease large subunit